MADGANEALWQPAGEPPLAQRCQAILLYFTDGWGLHYKVNYSKLSDLNFDLILKHSPSGATELTITKPWESLLLKVSSLGSKI